MAFIGTCWPTADSCLLKVIKAIKHDLYDRHWGSAVKALKALNAKPGFHANTAKRC